MGGMWLLIHQARNKKPIQEDDDTGREGEVNNTMVLESYGQDTSAHYRIPPECNTQPQDELETIPEEEEPQTKEKQDLANQDTIVFTTDESKEEPFNAAQMTYASQVKRWVVYKSLASSKNF